MRLLTVDSLESAGAKLLSCLQERPLEADTVPLETAAGRTLARDICADADIPGFRRSTVDGYAVFAADTAAAGESLPVFLTLVDTVTIGQAAAVPVGRGQCAYVPTGGMIPPGADAVVMIEYCEVFDKESKAPGVAVYQAAPPLANVALDAEDIASGALLLAKGTRLRPQETGALAASGITAVPVYKPLTLSIISTGDELVSPGEEPGAGQVRDVNSVALAAMARERGLFVRQVLRVRDDEDALAAAVEKAMNGSDVVAVSGGSSQGERDFTAGVFGRLADPGVLVHGIAVKPGKPTILAFDRERRVTLLGLPGHPVSAMVVFDLLFLRAVRAYFGEAAPLPIPAKIACNIAGAPGKTTCQQVALRIEGQGCIAEPVLGKSGMMSSLTRAGGYVIIDKDTEGLRQGEDVWVTPYA
jgi:molybdopterin molybdotransferase